MNNEIAIIWDFDKTLIDGYMEEPLFKAYGVDSGLFWSESNALPEKYLREQGVKVNPETIYLNHILSYVKDGRFRGLNNAKLRELGGSLRLYPGVPEIFSLMREQIEGNPKYAEYGINVEHYIVSTGLTEMIMGTEVAPCVNGIWGCEFIEKDGEISEVGYTIDNTTKTRALFEINNGERRVRFINMVYAADRPSDIPAFSVVNKNYGATFAVYPRGDSKALRQVEKMRREGRVNMFAEADYSEQSTACMWLSEKVREEADRIREEERAKIKKYTAGWEVRHLS